MAKPNVIVIGGGLAGLSAAMKLAELDCDVGLMSILPVTSTILSRSGIRVSIPRRKTRTVAPSEATLLHLAQLPDRRQGYETSLVTPRTGLRQRLLTSCLASPRSQRGDKFSRVLRRTIGWHKLLSGPTARGLRLVAAALQALVPTQLDPHTIPVGQSC